MRQSQANRGFVSRLRTQISRAPRDTNQSIRRMTGRAPLPLLPYEINNKIKKNRKKIEKEFDIDEDYENYVKAVGDIAFHRQALKDLNLTHFSPDDYRSSIDDANLYNHKIRGGKEKRKQHIDKVVERVMIKRNIPDEIESYINDFGGTIEDDPDLKYFSYPRRNFFEQVRHVYGADPRYRSMAELPMIQRTED